MFAVSRLPHKVTSPLLIKVCSSFSSHFILDETLFDWFNFCFLPAITYVVMIMSPSFEQSVLFLISETARIGYLYFVM